MEVLPDKLISLLVENFNEKPIQITKETYFVFVCGASFDSEKCQRQYLLEYLEKHLPVFNYFIAEKITHSDVDLLEIEKDLSEYADCIIIVLESSSTFAELGAFAIKDDLVKKIMIINDNKHKNASSFINRGPILRISKKSKFKPPIFINLNSISTCYHEVERRLKENAPKKNRKFVKEDFDNPRSILLLLADIVRIFNPLTMSEIMHIMKQLLPDKEKEIKKLPHFLQVLELLEEKDKNWFYKGNLTQQFYYNFVSLDIIKFRAQVIRFYKKFAKRKIKVMHSYATQ